MAKKRIIGQYPKAFRKMAVERLQSCGNIVALSKELGVHRRLLYKLRDQLDSSDNGEAASESVKERELRLQVAQWKRLAADQTLEADFFKGALHKIEARRQINLARRMKLTGINQLWVADITYIRLSREFVFLAVILDAFSRKVVGWELDRTLAAPLPRAALEKAIAERKPPGVVHHSDRGVQYASGSYVAVLRKHGLIPSMSRPANPYDNATCESFLKTLKREEIYANEYSTLDHLRENIAAFIDNYYNRVRLHSALGYRSPEEFEQATTASATSPGATLRFFRQEEIFPSYGQP